MPGRFILRCGGFFVSVAVSGVRMVSSLAGRMP